MSRRTTRRYGRYVVEVSRPEKVLFPDAGITKGDLIDYYERVADAMLPHVRGRIVAMRRFPDGIRGKSFFQKQVPGYFPDWIKTVKVRKQGGSNRQLVIENKATLVYLANQACITPHVWPGRCDRPRRPDRMIFDLDPSGGDFDKVSKGALLLRRLLRDVGLSCFVMTTGSRGLHVVVPLSGGAGFDEVRDFARNLSKLAAARDPERLTTEQRRSKRRGRVFLDCLRNAYGQHSVAPYAVRARPGAPVATPLDWNEVSGRSLNARKYTTRNLFQRLSRKDDPWKEIERHKRALKRPWKRLRAMLAEE